MRQLKNEHTSDELNIMLEYAFTPKTENKANAAVVPAIDMRHCTLQVQNGLKPLIDQMVKDVFGTRINLIRAAMLVLLVQTNNLNAKFEEVMKNDRGNVWNEK